MKEIQLFSRKYPGLVALVDDDDFELVAKYRWNPLRDRVTGCFYALTHARNQDGRMTTLFMHKIITGYSRTDHKNHNGLDNQRSNLRPATGSQNSQNMRKSGATNPTSRFKGVFWRKNRSIWVAEIYPNGRQTLLGSFSSELDAAVAYNVAAVKFFGDRAYLNDVTACSS